MTRWCDVDGCGRVHHARGLCAAHYKAAHAGRPVPNLAPPKLRPCTVDGCSEPVHAKDVCRLHYSRATIKPRCTVEGCGRVRSRDGLCRPHLRRRDLGEPLGEIVKHTRKPCTFDGCGRPSAARGLCRVHHRQLMVRGSLDALTPIGQRTPRAPKPPKPPKAAKPKPPPKPKPTPKPKSVFPPGWDKPAKPKPAPKPRGDRIVIGPVAPLAPHIIAAARDLLARRDALDLADMLGIPKEAA